MRRVTPGCKCPVCGHGTWCLLGRSVIICMRVQSSKVKNFKGGEVGYIHEYGVKPVKLPPAQPKKPQQINAKRVLSDWAREYPNNNLSLLADNLGVSVESLQSLGFQIMGGHRNTWGIPMYDGYGNAIGIRVRNIQGNKWAVNGSQAGIFVPEHLVKKLKYQ